MEKKNNMSCLWKRINNGEKIEPNDWMPDDYRHSLIRLISMHGMSEIMGALPDKGMDPEGSFIEKKASNYGQSSR